VQQYALTDALVSQIQSPMLVADPEGEQFWPGQSQQLFQALSSPKALILFTRAEGADLHCEPKAPGLRAQRIFDWMDATLACAAIQALAHSLPRRVVARILNLSGWPRRPRPNRRAS